MIQDTDITAWLGDAAAEMGDEGVEEFSRLVRAHEAQVVTTRPAYGTSDYHRDDYADIDEAAWIAAYEIARGTLNLLERGRAFRHAKRDATQGAVMAALAGQGEEASAQAAGMSRMTLRKALGKKPGKGKRPHSAPRKHSS